MEGLDLRDHRSSALEVSLQERQRGAHGQEPGARARPQRCGGADREDPREVLAQAGEPALEEEAQGHDVPVRLDLPTLERASCLVEESQGAVGGSLDLAGAHLCERDDRLGVAQRYRSGAPDLAELVHGVDHPAAREEHLTADEPDDVLDLARATLGWPVPLARVVGCVLGTRPGGGRAARERHRPVGGSVSDDEPDVLDDRVHELRLVRIVVEHVGQECQRSRRVVEDECAIARFPHTDECLVLARLPLRGWT